MPGRILGGRYTVQDKIGTGGMAIVYRGLDEVLGRTVAVKIMLPQYANDASFAARFKQEAQAAAALQSPYIVNVYDWGKDGDTYYIVMEYLRGTDLKSGIRKHGALDCRKVAQIGSQISQALTVAHRHDIIHRDVKPQNIMVQPDGNIKVMDFGIARAKNSHLTADNSVLGTAHYVSPEQTQGRDLGPTTDIYSLGIVMYEAATGRVPFDGDDAISVALKQVNDPPLPPSQINPLVDPALEGIILKCMQKQPADRFQSAEELYRVLRDYLAGRMQAVNQATSVVASAVTTRTRRPDDMTRNTRGGMRGGNTGRVMDRGAGMHGTNGGTGSMTTGHYRTKSATEEEQNRRHRRNVIIGIVASLILVGGIAFAAIALLGHPKTRPVPNLVGLSQEDAEARIADSNYFKLGDVTEEFSNSVQEGMVVDQDPDKGRSAEENTKIDLYISKGPEPVQAVTVPSLTGLAPTEADEELRKVGLKGRPGDLVYSDEVEPGKVAEQNPQGGTTARKGEEVIYSLSQGREDIEIPEVDNGNFDQTSATTVLEEAGFKVIVKSEEKDNIDVGIVFFQNKKGKAPRNTEIEITVSSGPSKVSVPNVENRSQAYAEQVLSNSGFYVSATEVSDDTVPVGYVVSQSVHGMATHGSTIYITVSTGPERNNGTSGTSNNSGTSGGSENSETGTDDSNNNDNSSTDSTDKSDSASSTDSSSSGSSNSGNSTSGGSTDTGEHATAEPATT